MYWLSPLAEPDDFVTNNYKCDMQINMQKSCSADMDYSLERAKAVSNRAARNRLYGEMQEHSLEETGISTKRLELARAVEREAAALLRERYPNRQLEANVEFYTAVLLDTLGLDRRLFTPTFAVGRVAGWLAHVAEQRESGRLIRPTCRYIGIIPEAA